MIATALPVFVLLAAGFAMPALLPAQAGILALLWLFVALALGWSLLAGYSGYISLGDILFLVIGMRVSTTLRNWLQQPAPAGMPVDSNIDLPALLAIIVPSAGIAATLAAVAIGALLLGMQRQTFTIATLGLLLAAGELFPRRADPGMPLAMSVPASPSVSADHLVLFHHLAFTLALLAILLHLVLRTSLFRLALLAIRENAFKAGVMGHPIHRNKVAAWAIAALLAGMAGAILDNLQPTLPDKALRLIPATYAELGAWIMLMAILGGRKMPWGPVIGTLFAFSAFALAALLIPWVADLRGLVVGLLVLLIATRMPRDLTSHSRVHQARILDNAHPPRPGAGHDTAAPAGRITSADEAAAQTHGKTSHHA